MKVVILGAGQVGSSVASLLVREEVDITVIDIDKEKLEALQEKYDLRTIQGHASSPDILEQAGCAEADMLIAATSVDEVNMVACQLAYYLFDTPTRIARIRREDYTKHSELFIDGRISVKVLINPESLVTEYIHSAVQFPSALEVMDFANGKLKLVGMKAQKGGPLVNQKINSIRTHIPDIDTRVAAIYTDKGSVMPEGDTIIREGDEVFFLAESNDIIQVMSELQRLEKDNRQVIIAGGGHIGEKLAHALAKKHKVKIIEQDKKRCEELATQLSTAVVLNGTSTNQDLLLEENIANCDIFCALTNRDEINIMSSLLAKSCGASKTIALINNTNYLELLLRQKINIDKMISPQQVTVSRLLSYVRRGDVVRVHSLRNGAAEAMEAIAHGSKDSSKLIGKRLEDVSLPYGVTIGALIRQDKVMIAHRYLIIEPEDHLIFFVLERNNIEAVEKLVQS